MTSQPAPPDEPDLTSAQTSASVSVSAVPVGFGPYRFLQRLGEGGMGDVWLAEQLRPVRRQVAIKIVKAGMDTTQVVARFEAERQALAVMDHPTIAKIFDGGTTPEGRPYFAMEYVRGEAITSYCDRQRLPIRERLDLFIQLCDGVQHAHQKGIIHRDLKPSNVLISVADDHPVPRIIDFGIARAVSRPLTERPLFTELGGFLGTPEYMSPEQAESTPVDVDTRSDIYSLGVLLYELLVGTLPFNSEALRQGGVEEIRRTIREQDPPRPSTRVAQLGSGLESVAERRRIPPAKYPAVLRGDLDWITMKSLEKDRTRRYATANALALDVRRHLKNEPVTAGPPTATYRTRKFVRRHRIGVSMATVLFVLLTIFATAMTVQTRRIAQERNRANQEAATAKQVSEFLVNLFQVSDPSEARGNTLTAREILANGVLELESRLREQPGVRARLEATIGTVYKGLGLYSEAEPLLKRALETQRQLLGNDDADTLETVNGLASLYQFRGRVAEAESLFREVVEGRSRVLGNEHPETLRASYDLASVYLEEKRFDEFERLGRATLDKQRRVLGEDHQDTLASKNNLQGFYYRQGRYDAAEPIAVEVLEGSRRLLGEDHPATLTATHNLATIYDRLGRYQQAEPLYLKVIDARRRVLGAEHPATSRTQFMLANMYQKQRRYREAESAALAAYQGYSRTLGDDQETQGAVQQIVQQLIDMYTVAGQPAKAAEWRNKLRRVSGLPR
jgi:non-specific serine/threonine protein kinase/serine/threonine-protein kinase